MDSERKRGLHLVGSCGKIVIVTVKIDVITLSRSGLFRDKEKTYINVNINITEIYYKNFNLEIEYVYK